VSAIIAFCMAVVVGVGIRLLSLAHPPLTPTSCSICNSFSSLGPAQKQCWETFFTVGYIGVGGVSWSPLPPDTAVDWHYVVTDFNCIPRKGDTNTHTHIHTYIHTCHSHWSRVKFSRVESKRVKRSFRWGKSQLDRCTWCS